MASEREGERCAVRGQRSDLREDWSCCCWDKTGWGVEYLALTVSKVSEIVKVATLHVILYKLTRKSKKASAVSVS
jgi:hypothetical protein